MLVVGTLVRSVVTRTVSLAPNPFWARRPSGGRPLGAFDWGEASVACIGRGDGHRALVVVWSPSCDLALGFCEQDHTASLC
jgi:hypothetical protein